MIRAAGGALLLLTLAGCTSAAPPAASWADSASAQAMQLPQVAGPYAGSPRLVDGLRPPTNSWVSGPVFGTDVPAYTGILAVTPQADGFSVGLPRVDVTPKTVYALAPDDLTITVPASGVNLSALDDLVAHWTFTGAGELVSAEGWPYVAYSSDDAQEISVAGASEPERIADDLVVVSAGGQRYGLVAPAAALETFPTMMLNGRMFVFAIPQGASDAQVEKLRAHAVLLNGGTVTHTTVGGSVTTSFDLATEADAPTLFGVSDSGDLAYETLYGDVALEAGTTFTRTTPAITESGALDLSGLSDDDRDTLRTQVPIDAAMTTFSATDSYGAGKELYRAATLYRLSTDLGLDSAAKTLHDALIAELDRWMNPEGCAAGAEKCFVFDPVLGGVVGQSPSFGSDEFNDHHFHYGYFLSAVGMLAAVDPSIVERYRTMTDLLALDIASPVDTAEFPRLRVFDAYRGHSWASGLAPYRDGNNQESVSEAVNAWNGLALWAAASGNAPLLDEARWMLSLETQSAADLWLSPALPAGFDAPLFVINWGGKRDYATFFDASPSAALGIELIPLPPVTAFLPSSDRVDDLVAGAPGAALADYIVMLQATSDPDAAAARAAQLPDSALDSANSRSYLLAWIMTR